MILSKFSALATARPPETTILAPVSSGRSFWASASLSKRDRSPALGRRAHGLDRRLRVAGPGRSERGGANRDHPLGVGRLDRLNRVAGVDRALERVGRDDLHDVRQLHDVEQRGDAGHDVLGHRRRGARRTRRRLAPAPRRRRPAARRAHGQRPRRRARAPFRHRTDLPLDRPRGRPPCRRRARARSTQAEGGGERLRGDVGQSRPGDFGEKESGHAIAPAAVSLATRSGTSVTLTPAERVAGSEVFRTFRRGVRSTP